ncbi:hypothetical protein IP81_04270 [Novosphingobium sp. AAP83]|uniref:hypothetical protein n=1 Tax=Novosphingobium sp. AAP83 TaxID=1523425 RepID=UPI0006B937D8|nr:hypothetical protein [Novosphingobium sp. AAP83]KPF93424.1 hypothetical protein IP81_04270 [Novosphingobium sp. AAP83]
MRYGPSSARERQHASGKAQVRAILEAIGVVAIDLGTLDVGGPLASLPFGPLAMHNFVRI